MEQSRRAEAERFGSRVLRQLGQQRGPVPKANHRLISQPQIRNSCRCRLEDTKNDEDRIVPLPGKLVAMLAKAVRKEGRVFDTTNLRKEWMTACVACGLGTIMEVEGKPYDP